LVSRVEFMGHDFFQEKVLRRADVYFFTWIMHNWSDGRCVKILRNPIPGVK
ncbi:O-methyltransferase, partial [Zopfia rhizophila CBS 207.26]